MIEFAAKPGKITARMFFEDENKKFSGKLGETYSNDEEIFIGIGKKKELKAQDVRIAAGKIVKIINKKKEKEVSIILPEWIDDEMVRAFCEGAILANYQFLHFKSEKVENTLKTIKLIGKNTDAKRIGEIYANAQNYSRELDEFPANFATPKSICNEAKKLGKKLGFKVTVFDKSALQKKGMNAFLGVAKGATTPPYLVKMEYNSGKKLPLFCIVGKGITFDTGGISLKPSKDMHEMKYDKSGAINVIAIFKAVSELKLPIRLLGIIPLTENNPDGNAQKPGDIVKAYNGKTIEVLNTDAEGRLVLADALAFAVEHKPEYIIDMATLTGAMSVALGKFAIGLFSNDDHLSLEIEKAGNQTHERVWRLPVWKEYSEMMKSNIADLKNISEVPDAGSITAAAFLKEFVGETKWAHLDIAAVESTKSETDYFTEGATGIGVRLVTRTLENMSK